jgi:hydroxyacylglutathione hydrolase
VHTPGHTPEHLSFLVTDHGGGASEPIGIATGDFVFVGDVGRPDLLETAAGNVGAKEPSARRLYESLQKFNDLPDYLQVWPAHGAGSACGKALGAVPQSTVGYEKRFNSAVSDARGDENHFVEEILAGQPEPPMYFARMKRDNKMGPAILGGIPDPGRVDVHELARVGADRKQNVVIDMRSWAEYAQGHVPGALYSPLNKAFPTTAGSYVQEDQQIYLVIDESHVHEAVIDLIRIGLDHVKGYVTPDDMQQYLEEDHPKESTTSITTAEFVKNGVPGDGVVVDVRNESEWNAGHLKGATFAPHTRLTEYLDKLPKDKKLYVHCQSGARSAVASALLQSHGYDVVYVGSGGYPQIEQAGLPVETSTTATVAV